MMSAKTYLACIVAIFLNFGNVAHGQPYKSVFGDSVTLHTSTLGRLTVNSIVYKIYGDTIVNGMLYKRVLSSMNYISGPYISLGLLREDTLTGKVWYRSVTRPDKQYYTFPMRDTIDKLVMDMSLVEGDTFIVGRVDYTDTIAIVDTIYYENGRKILQFNSPKFYFIEGISTSLGLCYKDSNTLYDPINEYDGQIICVFHDSNHVYSSSLTVNYGGACMPPNNIEQVHSSIINIYPNPNSGIFTVNVPEVATEIVITNINGQVVQQLQPERSSVYHINMEGQTKGTYLLRMMSDGKIVTSKFIVQ